jgi:flagellar basal-body rod protein FlgF/flagellar basal-body rod protein FlgG
MDSGYYALSTALLARTQALDTIANNLANQSTTGYKAQRNVFSSVLAASGTSLPSDVNRAINNYGVLSGNLLDLTQGVLQKTGNDLDLAIQGSGFFVVQTPNGPRYSRNGALQVSSKGQLVTSAGDPVMGEKGAIAMMPGPVSIGSDGTISSNGAVMGKLQLVDFPAGTAIKSEGGTYYSAPPKTAIAATGSTVQQGTLESSNVNPVAGMVDLINAQRAAEMMEHALSMFNSEIDKTATQDLPKIS